MIQAHFKDIKLLIQNNIAKSERKIEIAVAWINDLDLYKHLLTKLAQGISVELIIRNDATNNSKSSLRWSEFIKANGQLYFPSIPNSLHNKYVIIDDSILITGSYNWTSRAHNINQENVLLLDDYETIISYKSNFLSLKSASKLITDESLLNYWEPISSALSLNNSNLEIEEELIQVENSEDLEGLLFKARNHYFIKEYNEALEILTPLSHIYTNNYLVYFLLALVYFATGRFKDSLNYCEKTIAGGEESSEIYNLKGNAFHGLGQFEMAIKNYDIAIKLSPDKTLWYNNKMVAYDKAGKVTFGDKVALTILSIASNIIKNNSKYSQLDLLRAYIDRGFATTSSVSKRADGLKAKEIFEQLPVEARDYHDLDSINVLLK